MTLRPLVEDAIAPGPLVDTDECVIYDALPDWGHPRKSACPASGNTPAPRTAAASTRPM
ncbi:hypothetical protein [Methylomagnum sp.]